MGHKPDMVKLQDEPCALFTVDFPALCQKEGWDRDSQWTGAIQQFMARLGHRHGYRVSASQSRCPTADGPEWLYDHYWRVVTDDGYLLRIPLVMEIEWGFSVSTVFDRVREDYQRLTHHSSGLAKSAGR